jgi:hypothetical protein
MLDPQFEYGPQELLAHACANADPSLIPPLSDAQIALFAWLKIYHLKLNERLPWQLKLQQCRKLS